MINDAQLDRILTVWLAEGSEVAPDRSVEAAMDEIATTPQRRSRSAWLDRFAPPGRTRLVLLAAALLILALGVVVGVGASLLRTPTEAPPQPPQVAPVTSDVELMPLEIADWPVRISVPTTWTEADPQCCDFRQFGGSSPEGHVSVGHESPYSTVVCSPDCETIALPTDTIPYSADKQFAALKTGVEAIAGSTDWSELPADVLPGVERGIRLDTTALHSDGREWRRVHIIGLKERNAVAFTWSQPADVFDENLLEAVLADVELTEAPVYSDGDLITGPMEPGADFTMPIPGHWITSDQPTVDGESLSGVLRFAEGRLIVSIGTPDGAIGVCEPECRLLSDQTSVDALEASVLGDASLGPVASATLGGEPARTAGTTTPAERRTVVAMHGDRPVVVTVDVGDWDVEPGIVDDMIEGFAFVDPQVAAVDEVHTMADGRVELGLSDRWHRSATDESMLLTGRQELRVQVGDSDGRIVPCVEPAAPWELCEEITATTLAELATAVEPAPIADHGVGPPFGRAESTTLDGEPAVVVRIQAYEYPAKSGQEVAYVVAIHEGRPYIARIWTSANEVEDLDSVIAGFRFVD